MEGNGNNEWVKMEQHGKGCIKKYKTYLKSPTEGTKKALLKGLTLFKGCQFLEVECNLV